MRIKIERMGGQVLKWVSPGNRGVPDRIVLMPGGRIYFVEFKDDDGEMSELQWYWQRTLHGLGFNALIIKGNGAADAFIDTVRRECDAV